MHHLSLQLSPNPLPSHLPAASYWFPTAALWTNCFHAAPFLSVSVFCSRRQCLWVAMSSFVSPGCRCRMSLLTGDGQFTLVVWGLMSRLWLHFILPVMLLDAGFITLVVIGSSPPWSAGLSLMSASLVFAAQNHGLSAFSPNGPLSSAKWAALWVAASLFFSTSQ